MSSRALSIQHLGINLGILGSILFSNPVLASVKGRFDHISFMIFENENANKQLNQRDIKGIRIIASLPTTAVREWC